MDNRQETTNLVAAAEAIISNWDFRLAGKVEQVSTSNIKGMPPYWSPSASMVSSEYISALRKALYEFKLSNI